MDHNVTVISIIRSSTLRHAALNDAPGVTIAGKVEGNPFTEMSAWRVLQMEMDVRLAAVSGVADASKRLSDRDAFSNRDLDRSGLQVANEQVLVLTNLETDMIAQPRQRQPPPTDWHVHLSIVGSKHSA